MAAENGLWRPSRKAAALFDGLQGTSLKLTFVRSPSELSREAPLEIA